MVARKREVGAEALGQLELAEVVFARQARRSFETWPSVWHRHHRLTAPLSRPSLSSHTDVALAPIVRALGWGLRRAPAWVQQPHLRTQSGTWPAGERMRHRPSLSTRSHGMLEAVDARTPKAYRRSWAVPKSWELHFISNSDSTPGMACRTAYHHV